MRFISVKTLCSLSQTSALGIIRDIVLVRADLSAVRASGIVRVGERVVAGSL